MLFAAARRLAARAVFVACASVGVLSCVGAADDAPSTGSGCVRSEKWDGVFRPRARGFLGADGAASVRLDERRSLWVFGDTILGTVREGRREGAMVRNSVAVLELDGDGNPAGAPVLWDLTDDLPGDFFHSGDFSDPHWYWPGTGVCIDGKAYLFLSKMAKGDGPDGFAFQTIGCTLFRIDNPLDPPRTWKIARTELGFGDDHFNINAASIVVGDSVYLVGYDDGPGDLPKDRASFLARIPIASLDAADSGRRIAFLAADGSWNSEPRDLKPLFRPGATETAVLRDEPRGRYLALTMEAFAPTVLMTTAKNLEGPWSDPAPVFEIPELHGQPDWHAYATRFHPALSTDGRAVFTYVVNTRDFWGIFSRTDIYWPRFVEMPLGPEGS